MSCCASCSEGGPCSSTCDGQGGDRDRARNPSAVRLELAAGETLGTANVPEIVQVYQGPAWLELWSFDADTSWYVQRQRTGREGQRIVTDQRINSGPVSRRIVRISEGERATVRAWVRAVSAGQGWNDVTGRYSASTPSPYVLVLSYDSEPYEYGASSANAVAIAAAGSETIVAAHHARWMTVYAEPPTGTIETLDRSATVTSVRALSAYNVVNCADAWTRVRISNTGAAAMNIAWIATVQPPGMV